MHLVIRPPSNATANHEVDFSSACLGISKLLALPFSTFNFFAPISQEFRKPQQRLLRFVSRQILHSFKQMRRNVLIEVLSCRSTMRDWLVCFAGGCGGIEPGLVAGAEGAGGVDMAAGWIVERCSALEAIAGGWACGVVADRLSLTLVVCCWEVPNCWSVILYTLGYM